jgi:hypothetical protein
MLTATAWADVEITCSQAPGNVVVVSYTVTSEPNKVRAFALDIVLDNDANIIDVNDTVNANYTIFPGSISISGGEITDAGQAVADYEDYPDDTQPGLDSNGVTVEMGALYYPTQDSSPNAPPNSGELLRFTVDNDCNVTITQNQARGGVVLTNPSTAIGGFTASGCHVDYECVIPGQEVGGWLITTNMYNTWVAKGRPECWCFPCHSRGDTEGNGIINSTDLASPDGPGGTNLNGWIDAWNVSYQPCCDANNDGLINATDLAGTDGPGGASLDGWIDGWNNGCP